LPSLKILHESKESMAVELSVIPYRECLLRIQPCLSVRKKEKENIPLRQTHIGRSKGEVKRKLKTTSFIRKSHCVSGNCSALD
jgi:hypothetical protein